jgi:hypothetical protein
MPTIDYSEHDEAPPLDTVIEHVEAGMAWLDHFGPEEWWERINLRALDLDKATDCVLGQVFAPEADLHGITNGYVYAVLFKEYFRRQETKGDDVWHYGFLGYLADESEMLTSVWIDRVAARQGVTV